MNTSDPIYRPGLEGVIGGETAICTIQDGLRYRGYAIEELAAQSTFEEVASVLIHGKLPAQQELARFRSRLAQSMQLDDQLLRILGELPATTPMMDVMRTGASLLAHWDPDVTDNGHDANVRKAERLLAQLPVVMAACYRLRGGFDPIPAQADHSLAYNVLWMLQGQEPTPRQVRAMDVTLILYAEHEFNASTFTARVVASTLSDMHSAISAAVGALKGPLHGGANERVMRVLEEVGSAEHAEAWVRDALARKVRIMGFGHRVYKTGDPRARFLKTLCAELAVETGHDDLEQMAEIVEQTVVGEKGLPPNLDWPSARLYHYLGLPIELYTPLFVVARVSGWCAHVIEQLDDNRLIRPRSKYLGPEPRAYVPIDQRV